MLDDHFRGESGDYRIDGLPRGLNTCGKCGKPFGMYSLCDNKCLKCRKEDNDKEYR